MKHITLAITLILALVAMVQAQTPQMIWQREGDGEVSMFGKAILALGDQNNDGYADWAVLSAGSGSPGQINETKLAFFHGGAVPATEPYMIRTAQMPDEASLVSTYTVGDVNGDGYIDWIVVVDMNDRVTGRVCDLYFGGPGSHDQPDLLLPGSGYDPIGDFNGDGYDDLLRWSHPNVIFYGGNPMDTLPDWRTSEYLGVVSMGDLNGDGYSDFVSDCSWQYFNIYLGGAVPDTVPSYSLPLVHGTLSAVRDLNGDRCDDIITYVEGHSAMDEVFWGGDVIDTVADVPLSFCSAAWSISSAGDFNHDGYQDVVLLSPWCEVWSFGALALYFGHSQMDPDPAYIIWGGWAPFYLDLTASPTAVGLGDVNGDGVDDLAIGGCSFRGRGKVVILAGDSTMRVDAAEPRPEIPQVFQVNIYPNPFNSTTTIALDVPLSTHQVTLTTFNMLGQVVREDRLPAAAEKITYHYDASALTSGIYLLRATAGIHTSTQKLVLLR